MTLSEQLDFESCSRYHLVIAADQTTGHETGQTTDHLVTSQLTVDVINVNDHAPTFSRDEYRVFLPEDCDVGSFVLQLVATDADSSHGN